MKQLKQYCKIVNKKIFYQGLALAAIITFLDLLSKELAFAYLADKPYQGVYVFPFFNLVTVWNSGVSFGMFKDLAAGQYIFTALALAIAIFLIFWPANEKTPKLSFALSLVIGGAFGNIIDRIINGAVADFLSGNKILPNKFFEYLGLAWLIRLITEPRRLFLRYFSTNFLFIFLFFLQITGLKKFR